MQSKPIAAILYDFDRTLSPRDMQEYAFIEEVGLTPEVFWEECNRMEKEHQMDPILAYMYVMIQKARGKMLLNREEFRKLGRAVRLFPGVKDWFSRVNRYAEQLGIQTEHYIISSGLREIIEGTVIADQLKEIYAAEFYYDPSGEPVWPAMAVNYTSKTQFLFRINKGILDVNDHTLNEWMPEEKRRIPFRNMLYIGDGFSDVPCMRLVKEKGGHSIAVYQKGKRQEADAMLYNGRVHFVVPADYRRSSQMEQTVFAVLRQISAVNETACIHQRHFASIHREQTL